MIKHTIQHHFYMVSVKILTDLCKIFVGSQPTVDFLKVSSVIAVIVGFKYRIQKDGIYPQILQIFAPIQQFSDAGSTDAIIVYWRTAESDWINLIKNAVISPHK